MKKLLVTLLKVGISVAIIVYLVIDARRNAVFGKLQAQPKDWWMLATAGVSCFLAVVLTLIRWYYLVRALDLPFSLKEAFRLGFLSYLFNLAPMGIVGGDLLKAVMLARQQDGHRAESVATVFFDRVIGLYMLFMVGAVAIVLTGFYKSPNEMIRWVCFLALGATALGTLAIVAMLMPDVTNGRVKALMTRMPYVGHGTVQMMTAVGMYRHKLGVLVASAAMSVGVHSLFTVGIYLITRGLYPTFHPLATQFVIAPLAAATGVLPVSFGPFELVLDRLFSAVPLPDGSHMTAGQGLVVALGYRIITVLTAVIGVAYYLGSRQEVAEVLHEVEDESEQAEQDAGAESIA